MCASCPARAARSSVISTSSRSSAIGRARDHRRALPLRLHTCAEHHSAKPDLRHVSRCARLSRTHRGRPVWTQIPLTRNHTRHQCDLSPGRPHLDQAQWRLDAECHSSQGPRARENVSALPLNFSYGDALAVAGALALIGTWTSTAPAWANSSVRITSSPASNASSRPTSMR